MPVVILPGATAPTTVPPARLKALVEEGKRVVLPDYDVAISKRIITHTDTAGGTSTVYLVEPLDADYVEDEGMDVTADNSDIADQFATFEEALESATDN